MVGETEGDSGRRLGRSTGAAGNRRGQQRPNPRSGRDRERRPQQQWNPAADDRVRHSDPAIPPEVEARQLAPEVRRELSTLDRITADTVARHLVAAGELIDYDPGAALAHARAARARASRIGVVREAAGIAAYHCGEWQQALGELRAARRMGSRSPLLPLIADCERGLGRPQRAIDLARSPDTAQLGDDEADELRIVVAGARTDLGQIEQALTVLSAPQPDPSRTGVTATRLFYVYADTLLALGQKQQAAQWFLRAASADTEGITDAEERVGELTQP